MATKVDWLGLALTVILCIATLYIVCCIPSYPPIVLHEGFLASAGSGVMAPPKRIQCSKVGLNAVATPSLVQSGGQTWLCADQTNANLLIAGDTTLKMAYISRNDTVCISQDASGTIYTCMDSNLDPTDESPTDEYSNYRAACDSFYVKYVDISNALSTLERMQATILSNESSLQNSQAILDGMYNNYKCGTRTTFSEGQKHVCNAIQQARSNIVLDVSQASTLGATLLKSIQPALDSRAGLIKTLSEYHCDFVLPKG